MACVCPGRQRGWIKRLSLLVYVGVSHAKTVGILRRTGTCVTAWRTPCLSPVDIWETMPYVLITSRWIFQSAFIFYGHNPYSLMYVFIRSCCICKLAHSHHKSPHPPFRIYATYQYNLQPFGSTYLAIKVSFKAKFQIDTFAARWPLMPSFFNQMHM